MEILTSFNLSLYTLLVISVWPMLFFVYQLKNWHRHQVVERSEIIWGTISVFGIVFLGSRLYIELTGPLRSDALMTATHLAPLFLNVLSIIRDRIIGSQVAKYARRVIDREELAKSSAGDGALPTPVGREVTLATWSDLIVPEKLKTELSSVIDLLKDPRTAARYSIEVPRGILLYGPPGTGKTSIAKVMANTAGLSFFVLQVNEVISKWVGDSEKNLSRLFQAAEKYAPSIIFVDEIDSLGRMRGSSSQAWADNFLNHFLQLFDGVLSKDGIYIIGATNRQDLIDPALMRPGRFSRGIEVPLPDLNSRMLLFQLFFSKMHVDHDVSLQQLAVITEGRSPAFIKGLCNQAGINAYQRESKIGVRDYTVSAEDIDRALDDLLSSNQP